MTNEGEAREAVDGIRAATLRVASVERKERKKYAPPPFITSQAAAGGVEQAALLAQADDVAGAAPVRRCRGRRRGAGRSHHVHAYRFDASQSDDAVAEARAYIAERFGAASLPAAPIVYKTKKSAQDAHEAIRPTSLKFDPEKVRQAWSGEKGGGRDARETEDLLKLYTLIWNRFVACQMVPAIFDQTSVDIEAGRVRPARERAGDEGAGVPRGLRRDDRGGRARAPRTISRARCPRCRRARSCACSR